MAFDGKHILVVDDDPEMRDSVCEYLELRRFRVSLAANGDEMKQVMQSDRADLVLLDVGLPGIDGIQLASQIKAKYTCGIIMLTGHGDPEDRVLGLESGADDYVIKPFNSRELLARIHSVLRRMWPEGEEDSGVNPNNVCFGNWLFDTSKRTLQGLDGFFPELSAGDLDILTILVEKANTAVSRDELLERSSHRDWNPFDRSIDVRITRLRKKLEQDPSKPELIRTVRNIGYVLRTTPWETD